MTPLVTVRCAEPIGQDPHYRQPWSDVSIAFDGPVQAGRRELEPTLISRPDLERHLEMHRRSGHDPESVRLYEAAKRALDGGARFYLQPNTAHEFGPTIYTSGEYVDRAEAERMVSFLLATLGISDPQYEWIPPPYIVPPL